MPLPWVFVGLLLAAAAAPADSALATPECPRLAASGGSTDLYCIPLVPAPGFGASGSVELSWPGGPFTIRVASDGTQRWQLRFSLTDLPVSLLHGRRAGFVAWAASPTMGQVVRLGVVRAGEMDLGPVALDRFLILISAEPDTTVREWHGRFVLRGESASNRLRPADNYQFFLGVAGDRPSAPAPMAMHDQHGMSADSTGWTEIPMFPGLDMLPAEMALRPAQQPFLPPDTVAMPSRPHQAVRLRTGDTLELIAGPVRRTIAGRQYTMLGFNGQSPGPLIEVERGAEVFVRLVNRLSMPTTVHWHGIRLDNRFDGVPDPGHPAVQPGDSFLYTIHFPDAGIFWYHPHVREDIQQDLGLYGNLFVTPDAGTALAGPIRREFLVLDDLLVGDEGLVPYGRELPTHAAMGRFGNVMLINGESDWRATVRGGEVVRFYLTNAASSRTFNLSFGAGSRIKVVGSDQGSFARESRTESVVIAPAERYVVDVKFGSDGTVALVNRVHGLDHLYGRFFGITDTLGMISVRGSARPSPGFNRLRESAGAATLDSLVRANAGLPPAHTLELRVAFSGLPFVTEQLMRLDSIYFNPVEWEGTMPGMNWATTGTDTRWILRDAATGLENMDIQWRFRRGTMSRIRLIGARTTLHGMQHPIHLHGQRFLVLAVNGKPNQNPVWKDTVLVPAGSSVDILAEMSNPGSWMLHCHIAEHLEAQMMMHFLVEE
ncbi:MAG: multicopper oxidase family protein [Gemmatimonadota bacterium]